MERWLGLPSVIEYQGLNLSNLSLNSAYVIANTSLESVFVYAVNDLCYECPFNLVTKLAKNEQTSWVVDTSVPVTWRLMKNELGLFSRNRKRGILCEMRPTFNEFGVYRLDVGRCDTKPLIPTYNSYLPLLLFLSILLVCGGVYSIIKLALKCKAQTNAAGLQINFSTEVSEKMRSVDFYRGIVLLLLIFITSGAGGYPIFTIKYGGLSSADCLFLVYAWSFGIKIPLSVDQGMINGKSKCSILGDMFVRSALLILIGITIESTLSQFPSKTGTLWRPLEMIGASYLVKLFFKMISNLMSLLWCWILSGFLLVMVIISVSVLTSHNCIIKTTLTSTEYTYAAAEPSFYCNNNYTEWVNLLFTGEAKKTIYINGYNGFTGGALGLLSTTLSTMIGLKAGVVYLHFDKHTDRTSLWAIWGSLFAIGATVFAGMSYVVKCNLWPISSILFLTSSSHFFLIFIYVLTEYFNHRSFVTTLGQTSLPILSGHLLFSKSLPFTWPTEINNHTLLLLQHFWILVLWISVAVFLRKAKISFPF
ncbi:heparan-alpha-glucosaminide N-acetyltransferase [Amyelois transitella]|uniref:heparan-alpha-glucosaminide N-acetyltransferase n=1 Tax=Amyelois transitella TaxID=680683 RepID=UPI00298F8A84|nr:heparan-alpha-glucosaminide N-acetyltransferase [Amyelois transitella]